MNMSRPMMGTALATPDSVWVVVSAIDLGKTLQTDPLFASFQRPLTTAGRWVQVHYRLIPTKERFVFVRGPLLVDSTGREYKPLDNYAYTLGQDIAAGVDRGALGELRPIYEIPPDARNVRAKIDGHRAKGVVHRVDLAL